MRTQRAHAVAAERLGQLLESVRHLEGDAAVGGAIRATGNGNGNGNANGNAQHASRILVKAEGRMFFVKATDIDWIEADRNYVRLHVGKQAHTIRERISKLEETLDPRLFARIHRSTIVNLNRVREMQQWFSGDYVVLLEDGTRLRLSRHYRDRVEQQMSA
jgi:two-component system, LytTR family, response regulator